jgi:hypothetical protein
MPEHTAAQASESGWFVRVVCLDLLNPTTSFNIFLRKLFLLFGCVNSAVIVVYSVMFALGLVGLSPANVRSRDVTIIQCIGFPVHILSSLVPYVYAQRTGTLPQWCVVLLAFGETGVGILLVLVAPGYPVSTLVATYLVFASIAELPKSFFVSLVMYYCFSAWNVAAVMTGREPVAVAGYQQPGFSGMLVYAALALLYISVPVLACGLQARQHRRLLEVADAAHELSRNVAELLRDYDTAGVTAALDEYAAQGSADPALVASYRALVVNLGRYRPHLPNWMVQADSDAVRRRSPSLSSRGSPHSQAGSETSPRHGNAGQSSSIPSLHSLGPNALAQPSREAVAQAEHAAGEPAPNLDLDAMMSTERSHGVVAYAMLDFRLGAALTDPALQGETVSDFVDMVHLLAATTQGALHSFVGDTVQLSWSAAMKIRHPEIKAARFMCKVSAMMNGTPEQEFSVAGAAASGSAAYQFGGSGSVAAFIVSLPWRAQLHACVALAKRHRGFVCSGAMAAAASQVVVTRPVELLAVTQNGEDTAVAVHEVISERTQSIDDADGWMYVDVQQSGGDGGKACALQLCVDGFYDDAVAALDQSQSAPSRLTANLRRRAAAAQTNPPATFATRTCSCEDT